MKGFLTKTMKILSKNLSKGYIKLKTENLDDLWYLSQIVSPKDMISGKTTRKIKLESGDRKTTITKKIVFIKIEAEKIDYQANSLKILGPIIEAPDDIPRGSYHSFTLDDNTTISIEKPKWYSFQTKKLQEATQVKLPNILICVMDRETAHFALLQKSGYKLISSMEGEVAKKEERAISKNTFYSDIIKQLKEYTTRYEIQKILLASPAFWKEELTKIITDKELKSKIIPVTCSSTKETAINEVLRRSETQHVLQQDRTAKEINLIEQLLKEISLDGKATYGLRETQQTSESGAISHLLITDSFINQTRTENIYDEIDKIMKLVDQAQGNITIISSVHDAGKKLDGLGGIAALLRYKITY